MIVEDIKKHIRNIPDFPKKGIVFRDITTLIGNGAAFRKINQILHERYKDKKIDAVICVESRGFIFGSALAHSLGAAVIPVRKEGKLPHKTHKATYELEYGKDTLEIHQDALKTSARIIIVDDLLATGGTIEAVIELVKHFNPEIIEIAFVIELTFLKGRDKLKGHPVFSLVQYDSE
ncbi:MAG: adenine phosphoribosyltransferase [Candidatus Omnitrophota bacterium]